MDSIFNKVNIVLVGTTHPGNIGATARAMKTMNHRNLRLVNPLDFLLLRQVREQQVLMMCSPNADNFQV